MRLLIFVLSITRKRNAMTKQIFDAIQRATKFSYPVDAWYNEDEMNQIISEAVKKGWAFRASRFQCEWTEKGIEAAKKSNLC